MALIKMMIWEMISAALSSKPMMPMIIKMEIKYPIFSIERIVEFMIDMEREDPARNPIIVAMMEMVMMEIVVIDMAERF